ncbi:MAG: hypothetical protein Q9214_003364, partial [Letrouitia sp. 1 TL-2023]
TAVIYFRSAKTGLQTLIPCSSQPPTSFNEATPVRSEASSGKRKRYWEPEPPVTDEKVEYAKEITRLLEAAIVPVEEGSVPHHKYDRYV